MINKPTKYLIKNTTQILQSLSGTILLAIAAQLSIKLWIIPITLQTVALIIISSLYNTTQARYSVLLYTFLGAIGFPVFTNFNGGIGALFGPTGGYIWGFIACVYCITYLRSISEINSRSQFIKYTIIGLSLCYICGVIQLSFFVGFKSAVELGLTKFIFSGIIKIIILALILPSCRKYITNKKST
ncbi:biotin transporter BioY [Rickettsia endosymbiont of Cardiosporidium cionae]|uniref:biotin transporter BioY n=1 Tax=Rickettsia endosymbiont of Cardiosporidium cionae TaxID=2777155 RepID=UPI00189584B8|nr:biotin transporter BioY [Rickettsia endosymbiont of Cardiosporidium cionae]KAF8818457.1 biotin transporter BioY [Rickettsia endosymbiont of Cardiosporidium cionae]